MPTAAALSRGGLSASTRAPTGRASAQTPPESVPEALDLPGAGLSPSRWQPCQAYRSQGPAGLEAMTHAHAGARASSQRCCMMTCGALGVGFEPSAWFGAAPMGLPGRLMAIVAERIFFLAGTRWYVWGVVYGPKLRVDGTVFCRCLSMLAQSKNRLPLRDSRGCAPWSKSSRRQS